METGATQAAGSAQDTNPFASHPQESTSLPFRFQEHQTHTHKKVLSQKNHLVYTLPGS